MLNEANTGLVSNGVLLQPSPQLLAIPSCTWFQLLCLVETQQLVASLALPDKLLIVWLRWFCFLVSTFLQGCHGVVPREANRHCDEYSGLVSGVTIKSVIVSLTRRHLLLLVFLLSAIHGCILFCCKMFKQTNFVASKCQLL